MQAVSRRARASRWCAGACFSQQAASGQGEWAVRRWYPSRLRVGLAEIFRNPNISASKHRVATRELQIETRSCFKLFQIV